MEPYQIILLILLLLGFIYVSILLYVITNVRAFARRLKYREKALMILLNEKADILLQVHEIFYNVKVELTSDDKDSILALQQTSFEKTNKDWVKKNMAIVHAAHSRLAYHYQNNRWLKNDLKLEALFSTYNELDRNFRQSSSIYNADVAGYMYWLNVPFCRIGVFLLGYRKKSTLN